MADTPTVKAIPTEQIRWVQRIHPRPVLQQRHLVVLDAGSTKERNRHVWLDVPIFEESEGEVKARGEIEALLGERT